MSEFIFTIATASFALFFTMMWLFGLSLFCAKYLEYRMKEKAKKGGDSPDSV